ncbi:MAG: FkbM family methyltransferase [Thermoleophilia bacterium]|nr:FkbM family methyltransferase [Thermoleophilia bacterium]
MEVSIVGRRMRVHRDFARIPWERVERASYSQFVAHLRPGMTVLDVGAHIGTYTVLASQAGGPDGCVVAFEPGRRALRYLRRHLRWNGARGNTLVVECALGSETGVVTYYEHPMEASGEAGLLPKPAHRATKVVTSTVDVEVERRSLRPSLIKVDVEGWELDVLHGADRVLERHRPALLLSLHPEELGDRGVSEGHVRSWLRERGYLSKVLEEDHEIHVFASPCD